MTEKFYCVGCKQHYELEVHAAQRQPSKGGSFRHSLISECPKGHRVNKLCKKERYESQRGLTYGRSAETFESPYVGSKALSDISVTTDQLTETIGSGDFDKASLNSSGHQNIFANAEEGSPNMNHLSKEEQIAFLKQLIEETKGKVQKPYELTPGGYGFGLNGKVVSAEVYLKHLQEMASEEGNAPVQDPMEFGEMANWTPLDGTPSLKRRKDAEAGSFRDGTGCISKGSFPSMTCEHCGFDPHELVYYQCKQNDEDLTRDEWKEQLEFYFYEGSHGEQCQGLIDENKEAEGMTVGVNLEALEPTPDEPETGESMVPADSFMPEGSGHVIGSQSTSHNFTPFHSEDEDDFYQDAETFIAYPELKNHLVSIMPDKVYNINLMEDGDFQMSVANRYMDEVISAVSNYQATEKSESDFVFGQSKTTVAVAAASLAVVGAWLWNKRK
jgi:hypothetical protein